MIRNNTGPEGQRAGGAVYGRNSTIPVQQTSSVISQQQVQDRPTPLMFGYKPQDEGNTFFKWITINSLLWGARLMQWRMLVFQPGVNSLSLQEGVAFQNFSGLLGLNIIVCCVHKCRQSWFTISNDH